MYTNPFTYFHLHMQHMWQPKWSDPVWAAGICRVIPLWAGQPMLLLDASCCGGVIELYILGHIFSEKLWQYGLCSFQTGVTKLERFLPKKSIEFWVLSFGLMASCQKVPKFDFQSQFSMSKIIRIFLIFLIEEYQFRRTFFVTDFFW